MKARAIFERILFPWKRFSVISSQSKMISLHNWTTDIEVFAKNDNFEKVFSDFWVNLAVILTFFMGSVSCIFAIYVSWYERNGYAGPFRTLINQLVSLSLDHICICFLSGAFLDISRIIFGPLPTFLCRSGLFFFTWAGVNSITFITLISVVRFCFICIFKSIPMMNDNFLAFVIFWSVSFINFLATCGKFYIEEKIMIIERICTGVWDEEDKFKKPVPFGATFIILILGVQLIVGVPMYYFKNYRSAHKIQNKTDLGSFLSSFTIGVIYMIHGASFFLMNR